MLLQSDVFLEKGILFNKLRLKIPGNIYTYQIKNHFTILTIILYAT